jgi:hypothetical protein
MPALLAPLRVQGRLISSPTVFAAMRAVARRPRWRAQDLRELLAFEIGGANLEGARASFLYVATDKLVRRLRRSGYIVRDDTRGCHWWWRWAAVPEIHPLWLEFQAEHAAA